MEEVSTNKYISIRHCLLHSTKKNVLHQQIYYNNIELGEKLQNKKDNIAISQKTFMMKDTKENLNVDIFNYLDIKGSMVSIVTDKKEIQKVFKNVLFMTSNLTPVTSRNDNFFTSTKVLLFIIRHDNKLKDPEVSKWNDSLLKLVKTTKKSICLKSGTTNHFNSQGFIAAWGNKA